MLEVIKVSTSERPSMRTIGSFLILLGAWLFSWKIAYGIWIDEQFSITALYRQFDLPAGKNYFWVCLNRATYAIPISWIVFTLLSGVEFGRRRRVVVLFVYAASPFLTPILYKLFRFILLQSV